MLLSLKARRRIALAAALILPVGAAVLYRFPPAQTWWYPRCLLFVGTGWYCPGCGTARCLHALAHGDLAQALAYNAATVCFLPLLALWLARQAWAALRGEGPPRRLLPARFGWIAAGTLLAFGVLRNVPTYPLTLLAPHALEPSPAAEDARGPLTPPAPARRPRGRRGRHRR